MDAKDTESFQLEREPHADSFMLEILSVAEK